MKPQSGRDVTHSLVLGSKMNVTSSGKAQLEASDMAAGLLLSDDILSYY